MAYLNGLRIVSTDPSGTANDSTLLEFSLATQTLWTSAGGTWAQFAPTLTAAQLAQVVASVARTVRVVTATGNITSSDRDIVVPASVASAITLTIFTPSGGTVPLPVRVKNKSAYPVTVSGTIDGGTSMVIQGSSGGLYPAVEYGWNTAESTPTWNAW